MNYIICTTARGRSSVLKAYLKQLGAGFPDAWTNPWFNRERDFYNLDALCTYIQNRATDGHCGLRMHWDALKKVCKTHNITAKAFFDKCLPEARFIYFTRNNLHQVTETIYYEHTQLFDEPFDFAPIKDIQKRLITLAKQQASWETLFSRYNITPCRVSCEALIEDTEKTCRRVLEFLEIEYPDNIQLIDYTHDALVNHPDILKWCDSVIKNYLELINAD